MDKTGLPIDYLSIQYTTWSFRQSNERMKGDKGYTNLKCGNIPIYRSYDSIQKHIQKFYKTTFLDDKHHQQRRSTKNEHKEISRLSSYKW